MTLLDTIKSMLGIDDRDSGDDRSSDDRGGVTVEREPDDRSSGTAPETGSEDAVKGTETSETDRDTDEPAAAGTDAAGSTESMVDEDAEGGAEPGEVTGPTTGDAEPSEPAVETTSTEDADEDETVSDTGDAVDDADESVAAGSDATGSTGSITEETNESISAAEDAEAAGPTDEEPGDTAEHDVDVLKGIGPSYAEQLESAGVETVADLADADSADLAEETDISTSRIDRWTERAKARRQ
ncbi:helix-hairpin-helix domain-containing protein [Halococcus saccharolyticus]|uniref:Aromatic amino acid cluster protein n=1 Tax=Halococcus saccharolyticus DSM 5350 TaxID=1227455 RepID=M0MKG3_9EURY|nr:helix-hairpin-helix domain-containing protein [Halococcus saccharolyticus]EMA44930.1 hypothetical protein C449_09744 [Halococcus saccharolyticus DSM 5350]